MVIFQVLHLLQASFICTTTTNFIVLNSYRNFPNRTQLQFSSSNSLPLLKLTSLNLSSMQNLRNLNWVPQETSSTFLACGAVTRIPLSNLKRFISNPLHTHHVLTVLIAFLISLPFSSHFANSPSISLFNPSIVLVREWLSLGRRARNFSQSRRREEAGSGEKRRWMLTRERKAVSIVE